MIARVTECEPFAKSRYKRGMFAAHLPGVEDADAPPVLVSLSATALDTGAAIGFVSDARAGGVAVFLGTTRAERRPDGAHLDALDYEAYPEMARGQLLSLAERARGQWPILRLRSEEHTSELQSPCNL